MKLADIRANFTEYRRLWFFVSFRCFSKDDQPKWWRGIGLHARIIIFLKIKVIFLFFRVLIWERVCCEERRSFFDTCGQLYAWSLGQWKQNEVRSRSLVHKKDSHLPWGLFLFGRRFLFLLPNVVYYLRLCFRIFVTKELVFFVFCLWQCTSLYIFKVHVMDVEHLE